MTYGIVTSSVARADILGFFSNCLKEANDLYKHALSIALEKGIYDRPPSIPYPEKVDFVSHQSFLTGWFGERRPLNSLEISDVFYNLERNYFGLNLLKYAEDGLNLMINHGWLEQPPQAVDRKELARI